MPDESEPPTSEPPKEARSEDSSLEKLGSEQKDLKIAQIAEAAPPVFPEHSDPMWMLIHKFKACADTKAIKQLAYAAVLKESVIREKVCFNIFRPETRGRKNAWLFSDAAQTVARICVVAKITLIDERLLYWIEIQQRQIRQKAAAKEGTMRPYIFSNHSSIVVGRNDGQSLDTDRLKKYCSILLSTTALVSRAI